MTDPALDPSTPVLVGVGIVDQRTDDPQAAREPIALMIDAARQAGTDAGALDLFASVDRIAVPVGRWSYGDAGAMVADAIGAAHASTVAALPGVSQQTLLSDACSAIADGEITTALIVAGEAGHRLLRARIAGVEVTDTVDERTADVVLQPDDGTIVARHEIDGGLGVMPVTYYALIDNAWRYARGQSVAARRAFTARRYEDYSRIAVANPHGWDTEARTAADIDAARMIAFPYGKHHVSNWSVDQATALVLTSVGRAEAVGVPRERWVFPQAFAESNHAVEVSARANMHRCEGAELAAAALLDAAGCTVDDLDLAEFYTCFPIAVDVFVEAIGMAEDHPTSFTGAMTFAGGPFNNFALHSTAQLAEHLRARPGARGLVTTVSGVLTKYGFAIWGTEPNADGYRFVDVTDAARTATPVSPIDTTLEGLATVVSYTVLGTKTGPESGVIVAENATGTRRVVSSTDPALLDDMQTSEWCGRTVHIADDTFTAEDPIRASR